MSLVVGVVVREGGQGHQHGVAGTPLDLLLDEVEAQAGRGLLADRLGHPGAAVADHHHRPVEVQLGQGVQDVQDHGPAAQPVQRLRALGAHPGPLAGGEHDRGQGYRRMRSGVARHATVLPTLSMP